MDTPSPHQSNLRRPHPLAAQLAERLRPLGNARVLDFGSGSGRNTVALQAAGFQVCAVTDEGTRAFNAQAEFDAAVSTHALLHGTPQDIADMLDEIAAALKSGGALFATFGSKADARYGKGKRVDHDAYAPESGEEQGVTHAYFDEPSLRSLIERRFVVESIQEHTVEDIVGSWAHAKRPQGSVHWFVRAHRLP